MLMDKTQLAKAGTEQNMLTIGYCVIILHKQLNHNNNTINDEKKETRNNAAPAHKFAIIQLE